MNYTITGCYPNCTLDFVRQRTQDYVISGRIYTSHYRNPHRPSAPCYIDYAEIATKGRPIPRQ